MFLTINHYKGVRIFNAKKEPGFSPILSWAHVHPLVAKRAAHLEVEEVLSSKAFKKHVPESMVEDTKELFRRYNDFSDMMNYLALLSLDEVADSALDGEHGFIADFIDKHESLSAEELYLRLKALRNEIYTRNTKPRGKEEGTDDQSGGTPVGEISVMTAETPAEKSLVGKQQVEDRRLDLIDRLCMGISDEQVRMVISRVVNVNPSLNGINAGFSEIIDVLTSNEQYFAGCPGIIRQCGGTAVVGADLINTLDTLYHNYVRAALDLDIDAFTITPTIVLSDQRLPLVISVPVIHGYTRADLPHGSLADTGFEPFLISTAEESLIDDPRRFSSVRVGETISAILNDFCNFGVKTEYESAGEAQEQQAEEILKEANTLQGDSAEVAVLFIHNNQQYNVQSSSVDKIAQMITKIKETQ